MLCFCIQICGGTIQVAVVVNKALLSVWLPSYIIIHQERRLPGKSLHGGELYFRCPRSMKLVSLTIWLVALAMVNLRMKVFSPQVAFHSQFRPNQCLTSLVRARELLQLPNMTFFPMAQELIPRWESPLEVTICNRAQHVDT